MTDTPTDIDLAVDLLDAVLSCADVDLIGKSHWWDRARTALETAATGTDYPEIVAKICQKLQITQALSEQSSATVAAIGEHLTDDRLPAWRERCQRDAVYLVALTRIKRTDKRTKKNQETLI